MACVDQVEGPEGVQNCQTLLAPVKLLEVEGLRGGEQAIQYSALLWAMVPEAGAAEQQAPGVQPATVLEVREAPRWRNGL